MNRFAIIEEVERFNKVTYYTIKFEDKDESEFENFLSKHQDDLTIKNEYNDLIAWVTIIGNNIGAKPRYFRQENRAHALPPPSKLVEIDYVKNLRLYCMWISESIIILFNGAIKTKNTAQDCPNVKPHFDLANKLVLEIEKLMRGPYKTIIEDPKNQQLIIDAGTEIML
jgi:hypothetical protein